LIPARCGGLRLPVRFVARASIDYLRAATLRVTVRPSSATPAVPGYTAVITDDMGQHYFHFLESIIWLWAVQHEFLGGEAPARIVFTHAWDNRKQNRVQQGVLGALYPGVPILDADADWPADFDNVLIYDRDEAETYLNKVLEPAMGFARPHVMHMTQRVREALDVADEPGNVPRFLHVPRPPARRFEPAVQAALLAFLQPRGRLTEVDFANLTWKQQVRLSATHDVLLGVHGNGLTNMLWMRPGSLVLEFFPAGVHHYDYQFFAELCGHDYFGFEGDNIFPAHGRFGDCYGHEHGVQTPVTSVPLASVGRLVDAWAERRAS